MSQYSDFAIALAKEAGQILMDNYGQIQKLEYKLKTNFKTEVDDKVDAFIRQRIAETFPDHTIYSEENDAKTGQSDFSWVVDPLDGTLPYTYGINDHFTVAIALVEKKRPILGVIFAPLRNELYVAETGRGATCNGKPIHVSDLTDINKAMVGLDYGKVDRNELLAYQGKLLTNNGVLYTCSHACVSLSMAFVASGTLHAYLALKIEPWDMAAAVCLIRETGGKATTIEGKEWELGEESILVASPELHQQLLVLLAD